MLVFGFDKTGGFYVIDHELRRAAYAYATSPHADKAKRNALAVAQAMAEEFSDPLPPGLSAELADRNYQSISQLIGAAQFQLGELRHTSAGNIYRLEEFDGRNRVGVRRVAIVGQPDRELWDNDVVYHWDYCQWDSLPLVGDESTEPSFGIFAPASAS
jgi:hypothetical protein